MTATKHFDMILHARPAIPRTKKGACARIGAAAWAVFAAFADHAGWRECRVRIGARCMNSNVNGFHAANAKPRAANRPGGGLLLARIHRTIVEGASPSRPWERTD